MGDIALKTGSYYRSNYGEVYGPMQDDWPHESDFRWHCEGQLDEGHLWNSKGINPTDVGHNLVEEVEA